MLPRLWELTKLFVKLGTISFGGPAVHIATMQYEVCERRGWLSREDFLDLIGATYLIPGPNAVEMASHVGYRRAGIMGSIVAGLAFALPAVAIATALAWSYVQYGARPQVKPFFYGINAVVLGIIFAAIWRLGKTGLKSWQLILIAVAVAGASFCGSDPAVTLLTGGVAGALFLRIGRRNGRTPGKTAAAAAAGTTVLASAGKAKAACALTASAAVATAAPGSPAIR